MSYPKKRRMTVTDKKSPNLQPRFDKSPKRISKLSFPRARSAEVLELDHPIGQVMMMGFNPTTNIKKSRARGKQPTPFTKSPREVVTYTNTPPRSLRKARQDSNLSQTPIIPMTSKKEGGNRKAQNLQIKGLIQAKMTLPNSPSPVPVVSYLKNSPKDVESPKLIGDLNNARAICLI